MSLYRLSIALIFVLIPDGLLVHGAETVDRPMAPAPDPILSPSQVVEIQLAALQFNDRPAKDAGIATTFRFASPGNRKVTGPLERFTLLVKTPPYQPLIGHRIAGYGGFVQKGDLAIQRVTIVAADGNRVEFEFRLSRDPESRCWYTEGVIPIPDRPVIDPGKVVQISPTHFSS